jgi:hypothetical protein
LDKFEKVGRHQLADEEGEVLLTAADPSTSTGADNDKQHFWLDELEDATRRSAACVSDEQMPNLLLYKDEKKE